MRNLKTKNISEDTGRTEHAGADMRADTLHARMAHSILTFEGLYQYLAIIRGYDISRAMLLLILWGRRTPSTELYEEIEGALSSAERVRDRRLFPLPDRREDRKG